MIDTDFLIELRRNAYIECTESYLSKDNVIGIFGNSLPDALFYAYGLIPVPIEGVDAHIFKFGKAGEGAGLCDVIKSTLIYMTTEKCPILYSCKMYVIEASCHVFYKILKENTLKPVNLYKNEASLKGVLEQVYNAKYNKTMHEKAKKQLNLIEGILTKIEYYTDLTAEEFFLLKYYTSYMTDLEMRMEYFISLEKQLKFNVKKNFIRKIYAVCPRGNYASICEDFQNKKNIRLYRSWEDSFYGYTNCIFKSENQKDYS